MIKIYGDVNGQIIRIGQTDDPAEIAVNVIGAVSTLIIDPATNAALVTDYQSNPTAYTLLSGQLYKVGVPVVVAAPGPDTTDSTNQAITPAVIQTTIDQLTAGINAWDGLTTAAKQTFVINNFKIIMQILRGTLRVILWLYRRG